MPNVRETEDLAAIKHFQDHNEPFLREQLVNGLDVFKNPYIRVMYDLRVPTNLPKYVAGEGWRPIDTGVETAKTPQGTFSNRTITPRTSMKILEVIPEQFRSTFLATQIGPNAQENPPTFAQFFWEEQMRKSAHEINNNAYMGKDPESINAYSSGSTYAVGDFVKFTKVAALGEQRFRAVASVGTGETPATHPAKWVDADNRSLAKGWGTLIAELYSSLPTANKHATGAITSLNAVTKIETMYAELPELMRNDLTVFFMSPNNWWNYKQHYRALYPNDKLVIEKRGNITAFIPGTDDKGVIVPASWMAGSGRVIAAPPETLVAGTDLIGDFAMFSKRVETLHGYKTIQKGILAYEIADLECFHVNDQA